MNQNSLFRTILSSVSDQNIEKVKFILIIALSEYFIPKKNPLMYWYYARQEKTSPWC